MPVTVDTRMGGEPGDEATLLQTSEVSRWHHPRHVNPPILHTVQKIKLISILINGVGLVRFSVVAY